MKREGRGGIIKPLVIAGGAGGDAAKCGKEWCSARIDEFGNRSCDLLNNTALGSGGTSGSELGGGAGFLSAPPNSDKRGPNCFQDGMTGYERDRFLNLTGIFFTPTFLAPFFTQKILFFFARKISYTKNFNFFTLISYTKNFIFLH